MYQHIWNHHIYGISQNQLYLWINDTNITATSLEWWLARGKYPKIAWFQVDILQYIYTHTYYLHMSTLYLFLSKSWWNRRCPAMACGTLQENLNSIPPFEAKFSRLELPFCFAINGYISYTYLIILLHTDPEVCPSPE